MDTSDVPSRFFPVQRLEILRIATRSSAESLKTWRPWPIFTSSFWDVQTEVNGIKICPKPFRLFTDGYYIYICICLCTYYIYTYAYTYTYIYIYTYRFYIVFVSLIDIFIFFDTDPKQKVDFLFCRFCRFRSDRMDPSDTIFFQTKNLRRLATAP